MRISDWSSDVCSSDLYVNRNSHLHKSTDLSIIRCMPSALPDRPPQQERSRRTHARLLEATLKTLAEHGLDGATIPRIARVADVRSEERRVGKEWVSTFRSRWSRYP